MFADDTNISCQGESLADIENKINVDLDNVHKWLIANNLTLNKEKTEHMLIGSRQRLNQCTGNPHIVITYQLRSNDRKLYLKKPKTNYLKNSFSYRGATSWNNLPL